MIAFFRVKDISVFDIDRSHRRNPANPATDTLPQARRIEIYFFTVAIHLAGIEKYKSVDTDVFDQRKEQFKIELDELITAFTVAARGGTWTTRSRS